MRELRLEKMMVVMRLKDGESPEEREDEILNALDDAGAEYIEYVPVVDEVSEQEMKERYEHPELDVLEFGDDDIITNSTGPSEMTKNPGHHSGCTVMPNGKPIPENAEGYWANHDD